MVNKTLHRKQKTEQHRLTINRCCRRLLINLIIIKKHLTNQRAKAQNTIAYFPQRNIFAHCEEMKVERKPEKSIKNWQSRHKQYLATRRRTKENDCTVSFATGITVKTYSGTFHYFHLVMWLPTTGRVSHIQHEQS